MDENFLKEWSVKLNVPLDEITQQFNLAKAEMQNYFPEQEENIIFDKAKLKLKVNYKRKFLSKDVAFEGIIIANDTPRDPLAKIRQGQLDLYNEAKEKAERLGDNTILQRILNSNVVRIEEIDGTREIIPLWPKFKKNGDPNKMAGKDISSPKDSMIQTVYGICTPQESQEVKGFILELRGGACVLQLPKGIPVSFRALNKTDQNKELYILASDRTSFLSSDNSFLQEGVEKHGLPVLIEKFFATQIVDWTTVKQWIAQKQENPDREVVPDKFKFAPMILKESICVYQNFAPDEKGRIKVSLCAASNDLDDESVLCMADENFSDSVDFAQDSMVITIGRPWLPKPQEEGSMPNLILFTSGMFAYKGHKIPRVSIETLSEDNLEMNKPESEVW